MAKYFISLSYLLLLVSCSLSKRENIIKGTQDPKIPAQVYDRPANIAKQYTFADSILDKKSAEQLYQNTAYHVWLKLNSGKVFFNGPFTMYLRNIADKLMAGSPGVKEKIHIYCIRDTKANAITYGDGHIFVNLGLICAMENEDQLAAIIAHEIAHYTNGHAVAKYKKNQEVKENGQGSKIQDFINLKYSRENEQEADASALRRLILCGYNAGEMKPALNHLRESDSSFFPVDVKAQFNNEFFSVNDNMLSDSVFNTWMEKATEGYQLNISWMEEDIYSTHPDISKRVLAADEILKAQNYTFAGPATPAEKFNEIKAAAINEIFSFEYSYGEYSQSLYFALKQLQQDTLDAVAKVCVIKSLYMLSYLRQVDRLEPFLIKETLIGDTAVNRLHAFLSQLGITDLKKLAYGYVKTKANNLKDTEELIFYTALIVEDYLGKEPASGYYLQYSSKYPAGRYAEYVKQKLKGVK